MRGEERRGLSLVHGERTMRTKRRREQKELRSVSARNCGHRQLVVCVPV
jgi:hypothetical protein